MKFFGRLLVLGFCGCLNSISAAKPSPAAAALISTLQQFTALETYVIFHGTNTELPKILEAYTAVSMAPTPQKNYASLIRAIDNPKSVFAAANAPAREAMMRSARELEVRFQELLKLQRLLPEEIVATHDMATHFLEGHLRLMFRDWNPVDLRFNRPLFRENNCAENLEEAFALGLERGFVPLVPSHNKFIDVLLAALETKQMEPVFEFLSDEQTQLSAAIKALRRSAFYNPTSDYPDYPVRTERFVIHLLMAKDLAWELPTRQVDSVLMKLRSLAAPLEKKLDVRNRNQFISESGFVALRDL